MAWQSVQQYGFCLTGYITSLKGIQLQFAGAAREVKKEFQCLDYNIHWAWH